MQQACRTAMSHCFSVTFALSGVTNLAAVTPVFKGRSQGQMELCPKLPALEATLAASLPLYDHQTSHVAFMAFATESSWLCHLSLGFGRQMGSRLPRVALGEH